MVPGVHEEGWKQTPWKIRYCDSLLWCAIISLPYQRNKDREYLVESKAPQPELLEILRDLPVCTGDGVRRDVTGIEEFYSTISRETVKLIGFIDLSWMAAAA